MDPGRDIGPQTMAVTHVLSILGRVGLVQRLGAGRNATCLACGSPCNGAASRACTR